ncbi:hypothetical protein ACHAPU_000151 [Fusarium lateritium]
MACVLIRRLPLNTSEESLRLMVVWSQELADVELLPADQSEDLGFCSALLQFRTQAGAEEAKRMLDGRSNISNDAAMIVDIISSNPTIARRYPDEGAMANTSGSSSSAASASSLNGHRQAPTFSGAFQSFESISPQTTNAYTGYELPPPGSRRYQTLFSPQSPIGNHLTEHGRISGKSLIAHDSAEDDETSNLLKDPVAYAETNGANTQRRATAPHIPINRMQALSLNTNNMPLPGPSSLPQYSNPMSAQPTAMSPLDRAPFGGHLTFNSPFTRQMHPPVNPADQNPPCNTLYVGNLPADTSEEELKTLFSKQRGYKRLCFRTKQNGPMCFVEFEEVTFATRALKVLYGHPLHNSVKGGIRLSFSKNPLGVRSNQAPTHTHSNVMGGMNGNIDSSANGFPSANRAPPGLTYPPGLGSGRPPFHGVTPLNTGYAAGASYGGATNYSWNGQVYSGHVGTPPSGANTNGTNTAPGSFPPAYMMGR